MDLLVLALVVWVAAASGAAVGAGGAVWVAWQQIPKGVVPDEVGVELPGGKHYHHFDRTADVRRKQVPGYYCECGARAPEKKQPKVWQING